MTVALIEESLRETCDWIAAESGIAFPGDRFSIESYTNKQGTQSFNVRVSYIGPLHFRVVLDTNVIVSALLFTGKASQLVDKWKSGSVVLLATKEIVLEYLRVLAYPKSS